MHTRTALLESLSHRLLPWCLLLAFSPAAVSAPPNELAPDTIPASYHVLRLSPDRYAGGIDINASGQVAFTERIGNFTRARFYDGHRIRSLGTLGGPNATTRAMNDLGQVIGQSDLDRGATLSHAYRWSRTTGMVDLDAGTRSGSLVNDINEKGQVAGSGWASIADSRQFIGYLWSPETGKVSVGSFGNSSTAEAVNNAGTVAGYAEGPGSGGPYSILAFRWTRSEGIRDIGTLPDEFTWATDINDAGQIVGATPFAPDDYAHAFVWTPRQGLRDLGTGTGERSSATRINANGTVIGYVLRFGTLFHGFVWTRQTGMLEFGAGQPSVGTAAADVNRAGQVVGTFGDRAFLWTPASGRIDLNTRLADAPPGLVLSNGFAISDNGAIVAGASSGLYLLVPQRR